MVCKLQSIGSAKDMHKIVKQKLVKLCIGEWWGMNNILIAISPCYLAHIFKHNINHHADTDI